MRSIRASLEANINELIAGSTYVQSSIGPNQELLLLSFDRPFPYDRGQASRPSGPLVYKIHRLGRAGGSLPKLWGQAVSDTALRSLCPVGGGCSWRAARGEATTPTPTFSVTVGPFFRLFMQATESSMYKQPQAVKSGLAILMRECLAAENLDSPA